MLRLLTHTATALLTLTLSGCSTSPDRGDSQLVYLDTPEGWERLRRCGESDFGPLSLHFETQDNLAFCGPASAASVLNALEVPAPRAARYPGFDYFTQDNVFPTETRSVAAAAVAQRGMTLSELGYLLDSCGASAQVVHAEEATVAEFRKAVREALASTHEFVVVNYLRASLGQERGGHISPLAAYDAQNDSVLILDVSRYKYPPVWVGTEALFEAMATTDSDSGLSRGYVRVRR